MNFRNIFPRILSTKYRHEGLRFSCTWLQWFNRAFFIKILPIAFLVLSLACAGAVIKPNGDVEADTFGQGEVTVETPQSPQCVANAQPGDICPTTTVTVESYGISDNLLGSILSLFTNAANVFGGGDTTVIMPGATVPAEPAP